MHPLPTGVQPQSRVQSVQVQKAETARGTRAGALVRPCVRTGTSGQYSKAV